MTPIAETFSYDHFDFRLLKRQGRICLFEKTKPGWHSPKYEVVRLREYPDRVIRGTFVPAHEAMPASEEWGRNGFSYSDLPDAERKFAALLGGGRASSADHHRTAPPPPPNAS